MGASQQVRVGLAGLGRFGKLHASVLTSMPGVDLVAVCDPAQEEVATLQAQHPQLQGFAEVEELLANAAIDALFIVSPEPLHAQQALAALDRGVAVFVEKPLALTAVEAEAVARKADLVGLPLQVGFVLRFDVQHALLKAEIAGGGLGEIVSIRTKRNCSRAWFPNFGDRAHPVQETSIHDIDLLLWLLESPVRRVQAIERNRAGMTYPDGSWALLEFANGAVGIVESSWFVPDGAPANVVTPTWRGTIDAEIEVIGTRGSSRIRLLDGPLSFWTATYDAVPETGLWPELAGAVVGALRAEDAHYIERVRHKLPESTTSVADAIAGLRIGEAIVAASSGNAVHLA
ncbi:MAG: Gfo/Idh/MocA family oxidoreductase [Thermomicrobiales bacterium]|nr:Gfo/Idh/MocA family oxidoreductase [Thermomicrobiales bacterium]